MSDYFAPIGEPSTKRSKTLNTAHKPYEDRLGQFIEDKNIFGSGTGATFNELVSLHPSWSIDSKGCVSYSMDDWITLMNSPLVMSMFYAELKR